MTSTSHAGASASSAEADQTTGALRQSEEHLRLMIDAVRDYGIFMLDREGRIVTWNEGARRIKGYEADEILGRHFSIFYPPDAVRSGWPDHELEVAQNVGRFEDEGWRLRKDGSRFWANVVITALRDDTGELVGFTKVTRDLTERWEHEEILRRSEQRLEQALHELRQRNRDLQEFARVASHDLQEPLRKIDAFAELLVFDQRDALTDEGKMYLDRIRDASRRMALLIRELLAYAGSTARQGAMEIVDLNAVLDDVVADLHVRLQDTGGRVEWDALPSVEADATQMRQLFQNLVANGLKFHRPGVPPVVHVSVPHPPTTVDQHGQEVCRIAVSDNGIGLDEQQADDIFKPFHRLETDVPYEGTGLGLAICRRIMERHHGTITASSGVGAGATFTICMPLRRPNEARARRQQPTEAQR